jgi:hypothetical protein
LLLESFSNYPEDVDEFPVHFDNIAIARANDPKDQNWPHRQAVNSKTSMAYSLLLDKQLTANGRS